MAAIGVLLSGVAGHAFTLHPGGSWLLAGIPDNALRLDVHALAGLYSCNIRSFDGYIQSINPGLT